MDCMLSVCQNCPTLNIKEADFQVTTLSSNHDDNEGENSKNITDEVNEVKMSY